jgi:hypothetical protein
VDRLGLGTIEPCGGDRVPDAARGRERAAQPSDLRRKRRHRRVPILRPLRERAQDERVDLGRHRRVAVARRLRRLRLRGEERRDLGRPWKGSVPVSISNARTPTAYTSAR